MRVCRPVVPLTEATLPASVEMSYVADVLVGLAPAAAVSQATMAAVTMAPSTSARSRFCILSLPLVKRSSCGTLPDFRAAFKRLLRDAEAPGRPAAVHNAKVTQKTEGWQDRGGISPDCAESDRFSALLENRGAVDSTGSLGRDRVEPTREGAAIQRHLQQPLAVVALFAGGRTGPQATIAP